MTAEITTATTTVDQIATIEHLDPTTLNIGENVRDDAALTKSFVANIAENGVLVPITAVRTADGTVYVRNGQRRTLAAREAGLATVPVYITTTAETDDSQATVARIVHQIVTNDQTHALTDAQRARGIQQMIDAGLTATKAAKKLSIKKETINAAQTVTNSTAAMNLLDTGQLSLTEAAAFTEFEDAPNAVDRLVAAAGTGRFDHTVAQLRAERATAEATAKAAEPYADQGYTILENRPNWTDDSYTPITRLRDAQGDYIEQPTDDPSHWAVLLTEAYCWIDKETGEEVDHRSIDWNTEDDPDADAAEGLRHINTVEEGTTYEPTYYCTDPDAAGLTVYNYGATTAAQRQSSEADDQAQADAAARERRKVLALNKLGEAAKQVRRDFLIKLLARKTAPKGAAVFTAHTLATDPHLLSVNHSQVYAAEILGIDSHQPVHTATASLTADRGDGRAQVVTLGLILGALESLTPKDAWRGNGYRKTGQHLEFLASQGYQLAPIEEVMTGARTSDDVYQDYLDEISK